MNTPPSHPDDPRLDDLASEATQTELGQNTRLEGMEQTGSGVAVHIGTTMGPYRVVELIGAGGMGAVFKAEHVHLGKTVALKVLPASLTGNSSAIARFKREMKAIGKLTHPNIVQAFDAGEVNGVHFLAMEFVAGTDLQKWVRRHGPASPTRAAEMIRQAALGLSAAHALKLYHRDIKPLNLLVTDSGEIKVLDLGLARLAEEAAESVTELTGPGETMGTPDFMAPEQWSDSHSADARTDLYALGCTLFFLLTGRAPFATETRRTAVNKMTAHLTESAPDLRELRSDTPAALVAIYTKLMRKNPDDRFQTADELVAALAPLTSGQLSGTFPMTTANRPVRRSRWLIGGGAAVALAIAGLYVAFREKSAPTVTAVPTAAPPASRAVSTVESPASPPVSVPSAAALPPAGELPAAERQAAERAAAEWVQSIGGELWLRTPKRGMKVFAGDPLPEGEFAIENCNIRDGKSVTDKDLARFAPLSALNTFVLFGASDVSDVGLRSLTRQGTLRVLAVHHSAVGDEIWRLAEAWPRLEVLSLEGCQRVRGEGIERLAACPRLKQLVVGNTSIPDDAWARLPSLPSMEFIQNYRKGAASDQFTMEGIRHLVQTVPQLQMLVLNGTAAEGDPQSYRELSRLAGLASLSVTYSQLTPATLEAIASIRSLRRLELMGVIRKGNISLEPVSQLREVTWLRINEGHTLSDAPSWTHPAVEEVGLTRSAVSGGLAPLISPFPHATTLSLEDVPAMKEEDVDAIVGLTMLKSLNLKGNCEKVASYLPEIRRRRPDVEIIGSIPAASE